MIRINLFCLIFFLFLLRRMDSYPASQFMQDYPTPFTKHNRIMGFVLAFNHYHIDPLVLILNEYVSMCEAGWSPTMVLFTTVHWSDTLLRYFRQKGYCYRTNSSVEIRTSYHDPSINIALGAQHRSYLAKEINNFDVFFYHEDDMIFKLSHLAGYIYETKKLHELMPDNGLLYNVIGFQRFRRLGRGNDMHYTFGEQDIIEQELLEEMPNFVPMCIKDVPYLRVDGNIHQAVWVFTQQQIHYLQEKCEFFNQSSPSREYMSSFSIFDHKPYHCGMTKLLPAERLYTFSILHYYQQRHVSWTSVFLADENIRAGYNYRAPPRQQPQDMPSCWATIVQNARREQEASAAQTKPPAFEITTN